MGETTSQVPEQEDDRPQQQDCTSPYFAFQLNDEHLTRGDLDKWKRQCDEVGTEGLEKLQEVSRQSSEGTRLDLYALLQEHHDHHPALQRLWDDAYHVPDWVDWEQIERGQEVFWRYGFANLIGFALQGFMGGNAATPGIAEVLIRTGGFSANVVLRRALETFQGLLQSTRSLKDLKPYGAGHTSLIRVRLLHANVRQRMLKLSESDPSYFDVDRYGLPINTCDDIHTIALFACNPVWIELPAMGLFPRPDEIIDYIAMFRYIAHVMGVPDYPFVTSRAAKETMEAMCVHECAPNKTSQILCHNFIVALKDVPPVNLSAGFIAAASQAINGKALSDALGAGEPDSTSIETFKGFCWLARTLVYVQRKSRRFDKLMINFQREFLYSYIVEGSHSKFSLGGPSKFDMKHVPRLGKHTGKGQPPSGVTSRFLFRPLECLFFATFLVGTCLGPAILILFWALVFRSWTVWPHRV